MPWFLHREEAEALLATITRNPDYSYHVAANGCGPGFGIMVTNADGILLTEAYGGEPHELDEKEHEIEERPHTAEQVAVKLEELARTIRKRKK